MLRAILCFVGWHRWPIVWYDRWQRHEACTCGAERVQRNVWAAGEGDWFYWERVK